MNAGTQATAGVIARPPYLFLGTLAVGLGADALWPTGFLAAAAPATTRHVAAAVLAALGLALMAAAARAFARARTPVPTWRPTTSVVADGVYRYTRNPIYLAMAAIYLAIALAAASEWALVLLAPLLLVIRYGVVAREERYLEARFGDGYRAYKARVRRWL